MDPWEGDDFFTEVDDNSDDTDEEDGDWREEDELDDFSIIGTQNNEEETEESSGCPQDKDPCSSTSNTERTWSDHNMEQLKKSQVGSSVDKDKKENKRQHECQTSDSGLGKKYMRESQEIATANAVPEEEEGTRRELLKMLTTSTNAPWKLDEDPVTSNMEQNDHLQLQQTIGMIGGMAKDSIVIGANYGRVELTNEDQSKLRLLSDFDDRLFVKTNAVEKCEQHLLQRGMVTITGRSGEGKTTASLYFLKTLSAKESREPLILTEPSQWDHIPTHDQLRNPDKYIVFIDDVFGRSNLVQHLQTQWEQKLPMMLPLVEAGVVWLIMVFRTNIFLLCKDYLRQYEIFQKCPVVELSSSGEHNERERKAIFENHINIFAKQLNLSPKNKLEIIHSSQVLGFPQCCKLFARSSEMHSKGSVFFTKPLVYLSQCLESLSKKDSLSNLVLLLVLFHDGRLPLKVLNQFERSMNDKEILEDLIQICVTPDSQKPTLGDILLKAHSLCGSYLTWDADLEIFSFLHHSVSDTIFLQFCRTYMAKGIQICSAQTLLEYIRTVDNNEDWIVVVPDSKFSVLAERLTREMLSENCLMILTHSVFNDARFRKFITTVYLDSDLKKQLIMQETITHNVSATLYFSKDTTAVLEDNHTNLRSGRDIMNQKKLVAFVSSSFLTLSILKGVEKLAMTLLTTAQQVLCADEFSVVMENLLACAFYQRSKHLLSQLMEEGAQLSIKCFVAICLSAEVDMALFDLAFDFMKNCDCYIGVLQDMLHFSMEHGRFMYFEKLAHLVQKKDHGSVVLQNAFTQVLLMFHNATPRWFLTWNDEKLKHFGIVDAITVLHNLGVGCTSKECILLAAGCHDNLALKSILQYGGNIKCKTTSQHTPLHIAALFGSLDTMELLLCHADGEDINAEDVDGLTPLHFAAKSLVQSSEKVDSLIQLGSNVLARTKAGKSALTLTIQAGNIGSMTSLLQASETHFKNGEFPVHTAMTEIIQLASEKWTLAFKKIFIEKRLQIIEVLLSCGYSLSDKNDANCTPLHLAIKAGNLTLLENFINRVNTNDLSNLLHHSIAHSQLSIVKLLYCKCSDVLSENGDSPLHTAVTTLHERNIIQYGPKTGRKADADSVLEYLLENGADTNYVSGTGSTPLHLAALDNNPGVVVRLLRKCAKIDTPNINNNTALIIASRNGHFKVVRCLLENGADVNVKGETGDTPLHAATRGGHVSLVKYLTERVANINVINNDGETCFEIAATQFCNTSAKNPYLKSRASLVCETDHGKILKFFLDKRSDTKYRNTEIFFLCAAESGLLDLVKSLFKQNVEVNARDTLNRTCLHRACEGGHVDMVEYLVKKGADTNAQDAAGDTPLHVAARGGHLAVFKYLIGLGTDPSMTNNHEETCLVSAAQLFCDMLLVEYDSKSAPNQVSEIVALLRCLLCKGIGMNLANRYGDRLLQFAAESGMTDIVEGLVRCGADVNNTDSMQRMLLHKASNKGHLEIVKLLVENGADCNARDNCDKTALEYGIDYCLTDIVKVVMENKCFKWHTFYSVIRPLLYNAAFHGYLHLVEYLVEKGHQIPSVTHQSCSRALSVASYRGDIDIVKVLVEKGGEVNAVSTTSSSEPPVASVLHHFLCDTDADMHENNKSELPVYTALQTRHVEVVRYLHLKTATFVQWFHAETKEKVIEIIQCLVHNGECLRETGILNRSPLYNAASNGHTEVMKYFLANGADPNAVEISRKTALQSAAENGHEMVVKCFVDNGADIEAADALKRRPLHYAASAGHDKIVHFLVESGADMEAVDLMQKTPLHIAAEKGHVDVVGLLVEKGADLEAEDGLQRRSLHSAARQGHTKVVKILVEKGADTNATDCSQKSPLQIAQEMNFVGVIRCLTSK